MKVLVTGATGFLGSHLCRHLASGGNTVTILRRTTSNVAALAGLDLRHEIGEITDAASVARSTRGQQVVIHAAACLSNRNDARALQYQVNVEGTRNVVEACLKNGVSRLLHVSSVAAIGIPEDARPANEDFAFNLRESNLHYYISKHEAEHVIARGSAAGLDAVIVNPTGIWGPARSFYRGAAIIEDVRRKRILRYASGGVCVVHVDDVIDGLLAALDRGVRGNRYILGGENIAFRQLMEKVAAAIGVDRRFVRIPNAAMNWAVQIAKFASAMWDGWLVNAYANFYCATRSCYYDSTKARLNLGFQPRGFDAILKDCLTFTPRRPFFDRNFPNMEGSNGKLAQ